MKPSRGKLPLSIIVILICAFIFIVVSYTEDAESLSSSKFRTSSCSKQDPISSTKQDPSADSRESGKVKQNTSSAIEDNLVDFEVEEKVEFDPNKCSVTKGKWVFNSEVKPLYSDSTCPYLDIQVSCVKNGRPDSDYRHWEWQPDDCTLPRFDPVVALKKLRGKRLLFVGDSLQRGQWQSFVCLVESRIPADQKSMRRGRSHSVFMAKAFNTGYLPIETFPITVRKNAGDLEKEYNASIEFYWAPFLVQSNSDLQIKADPNERILRVDSVSKHAKHWMGVDILVFNTYVWWMSGFKIKSLWGSFANGEDGFEELDAPIAYRIALKTWANWVDSNIDVNKTRLFFTTMSPTHLRSSDWNNKEGIRCYNETRPVMEKGYWGSGSDQQMMGVVTGIVERMKVPVSFINITQLSEYRIDGHTSVYTEYQGEVLTDEQKADPQQFADCIHWCLPGVPDTWNQLFYAYL